MAFSAAQTLADRLRPVKAKAKQLLGTLPSRNICSSAKLTSANCMTFARFGMISEKRVMILQRFEAKMCTL